MIYLDNAATTYPKPECVYREMDRVNRTLAYNAGRGSYKGASSAQRLIGELKDKIRGLVHAKGYECFLTPSATIALNEIIGGIEWKKEDRVFITPYEHNAVVRPLYHMRDVYGFDISEMPLDKDLNIDLGKLKYTFSVNQPTCVIMTHVSNVTGYVVDVEMIAKEAGKYGAITVLDVSQSLGVIPVEMEKWKIDFLAFAGHKGLYGPFGIGGFVSSGRVVLRPYICGGTGTQSLDVTMPLAHNGGYEPGSPNIVAVAGLNGAIDVLDDGIFDYEKEMREYLVDRLRGNGMVVVYQGEGNCVGNVAINYKGYRASDVGSILDEEFDIAVRTGYQCAPLIHKYLRDEEYGGVVRISLSRYTTKEEIDKLVNALESFE